LRLNNSSVPSAAGQERKLMIANTESLVIPNGHALREHRAIARTNERTVIRELPVEKSFRIRPYRHEDRKAICQLCCDTGFLGQPVDSLFQDRDLFAELFTRPYLDHEPEWGTVAESNGQVVAYLLGSACRHFDLLQLATGFHTATKMVWRLAAGRYANHPRSRKFVRWLFTDGFSEQPKHPRGAAHLHFDIHKDYWGCGIARRLWQDYEQRLRAADIQKCYGAFFSYPRRRPEFVYARYGFTVFDRRRTTLFEPEISEPVEVVCVHKNL
jgi:ribosomal protein S18 acetylase RimI-like enzyme